LERRLANLTAHLTKDGNQRWIPKHPEVFLDESYCHLDHTAPARWIIPGTPVAEPGRSSLLVIFAAFVVWYDKDKEELRSKFVDESVYVWPSIGKAHTKSGGAAKSLFDKEVWNDVPPEIKAAGIVAPTNNYHGNFTALLFDCLFTRICKSLQGMGLKNCRIHLDGASYHFHKTAAKPAGNAKLEDLREWADRPDVKAWLDKENRHIPVNARRKDIEPHVKAYVRASTWTIYAIAKQYGGHIIRKTPPYHCELQPIEKIWACVKNKVAASNNGRHTPLSLKRTLIHLFFTIPESTFLGVWNESIRQGTQYWTAAEKVKAEKERVERPTTQNDNNNHNNNHNNNGANNYNVNNDNNIFDDEVILGDLSEKIWTLTLHFINNQDNIDKHVQFDKIPDGEDDEDAGVDPDIDEEKEDIPLNHPMSLAFLLNPSAK
ncbi:hypothetical protein BGX33_000881, partial [Mortierella sp. NVP41]